MPSLARWIGLGLLSLGLLALSASLPAQTDKKIQEIVIHSGWGGLGTPQDLAVTIVTTPNGFKRDGKPVNAALVKALVSAAANPIWPTCTDQSGAPCPLAFFAARAGITRRDSRCSATPFST